MQQNCKCGLCSDGDETIKYITEWSKLTQKEYKTLVDEEGDPLGNVQKIGIWLDYGMVYT